MLDDEYMRRCTIIAFLYNNETGLYLKLRLEAPSRRPIKKHLRRLYSCMLYALVKLRTKVKSFNIALILLRDLYFSASRVLTMMK